MKVFKEDTFDNEAGVFEMEAHHFSVGSQRVLKMLTLSVSYSATCRENEVMDRQTIRFTGVISLGG